MDDTELWRRFAAQDLSHAEWEHRAHVRTAYLHLSRYEIHEAHLRMRAGIIRLNHRHDLVESLERGYFETLTRVWLHLVRAASRRCDPVSSIEMLMSTATRSSEWIRATSLLRPTTSACSRAWRRSWWRRASSPAPS